MTDSLRPLTALLGEPGARDSQGFSNVTTSTLVSRPITITDADGKVIYEKQTADNPKSADSHIRAAGYRRTGEWIGGAAPIEKTPLGAKLKKPAIVLAVLALVIVGISTSLARSAAAVPEAAQKACHDAVTGKLPAGAGPDFQSTSILDNKVSGYGGNLYVVAGDLRSPDIDGTTHNMTYRCEAYVDSSGGVHKVTAGTTWK